MNGTSAPNGVVVSANMSNKIPEEETVAMNDRLVSTVEQYLHAVDRIYQKFWGIRSGAADLTYSSKLWYRGMKDQDYLMLPSIARGRMNASYEKIYLSKFKSKAIPYLGQLPSYPFSEGLGGYWSWLFLMQHYGVPTRLMDWSEDALVALLFAIDVRATAAELQKNPIVWCLNPVELNKAFHFNDIYPPGYIPNVEEESVFELFGPQQSGFLNKKPGAVYGPLNSTRIVAQRGVFTIFPYTDQMVEFNKLADSAAYLDSIIIDKNARISMTEELRRYGINYAQLFPEIGYVALEITEEGY
jgi:hypothetical protein